VSCYHIRDSIQFGGQGRIPIHIAIILPASSKLSAQLDTSKDPLLAADAANKLDSAVHAAGDVHSVTNIDFLAITAHIVRRGSRTSYQRVEGCLASDCGAC
jgi:hypothetical protein